MIYGIIKVISGEVLCRRYSRSLEEWFLENRRMSFRGEDDKNPYHVWISEVMLQQTRIEAVISYYERFMEGVT